MRGTGSMACARRYFTKRGADRSAVTQVKKKSASHKRERIFFVRLVPVNYRSLEISMPIAAAVSLL